MRGRVVVGPFQISFSFAVSTSRFRLQESKKSNILSSIIDASLELPETPSLAQMQRIMLKLMLARMAHGYSPFDGFLSSVASSVEKSYTPDFLFV
jgi:hypothetical protein